MTARPRRARAKQRGRPARTEGGGSILPDNTQGGLVGFASVGKGDADMKLRMTPTGHALAFRLTENLGGTKGFKVLVQNSLAEKLAEVTEQLTDQRVTAWGKFTRGDVRQEAARRDHPGDPLPRAAPPAHRDAGRAVRGGGG